LSLPSLLLISRAWQPRIFDKFELILLLDLFLAIHPFQDGDGRLSCILTTLLPLGYVYVPYSSLESIIEQNKEKYYLALQRT